MGQNLNELKDKVSNTVEDIKDNENYQKVIDSTKGIVRKAEEKSKDLLNETKRTFRRASEELDAKLDKLRK